MKERDEIEELFSSAFSDFEKIPPIDVKAAIDESIQGTLNEKRRKGGIIWIMSSIIALVLLSWMGIRFFSGDEVREIGSGQQLITQDTTEQETGANREHVAEISDREMKDPLKGSQKNNTEIRKKSLQTAPFTNSTSTKKEVNQAGFVNTVIKTTVKERSSQKGVGANSMVSDRSQKGSDADKKDKSASKRDTKLAGNVVFPDESAKEIAGTEEEHKNMTEKPNVAASDIAKVTEQSSDSSNDISPEVAVNPVPPTVPEIASLSPWSYTLYAGTTNGFSRLNYSVGSGYQMKEKFGISASFESNYQLSSRFGIAAGLDFNYRKDVFQKKNEATDSTFTGNVLQYIYDPQVVDSIIDSMMVATYSYSYTLKVFEEMINHFSIAIPLYFNVNVFTEGKWSMKVNAGMRFSYVSNKLVSNPNNLPNPEFRSFGLRGSLRPQILYTTDSGFGIGGYVNVGYDIIPAVQWSEITRNRIDLGAGLLFRFSF